MPKLSSIFRSAILPLALAVGSCGGGSGGGSGGGGSGGGGAVANRTPVFVSATSVTFRENTLAPAYIAQATDADGDALVYAPASGGADNSRFTMRRNGEFYLLQDFENPRDVGADNVYELRVSVTDGKSDPVVQTVLVTFVNGAEYETALVASAQFSVPDMRLTAATKTVDGTGRIYTAETGGVIRIWTPGQPTNAARPVFLDLRDPAQHQITIYGMAPAPDFPASGRFFVLLRSDSINLQVRSYRTLAGNRDTIDPSSGDVIFQDTDTCCSAGGWIGFGPDNLLYIGVPISEVGPSSDAQLLTSVRGKILRVDIRSDAYPADALRDYSIPATNPYVNGGGLPEIWVRGFANPRSGYFDPANGNLYVVDPASTSASNELNIIRPSDGGQNYGFPICNSSSSNCPGTVPPVFSFLHAAESGGVLTTGLLYRGPFVEIDNAYLLVDDADGLSILEAVENRLLVVGQTFTGTRPSERRFGQLMPVDMPSSGISIILNEANDVYVVMTDGSIRQLRHR